MTDEELNNEHILNFFDEKRVLTLPDWLPSNNLKLIIGAGDGIRGEELDVQRFTDYNVFYHAAYVGKEKENIEFMISHYHHEKIMCIIDHKNPEHQEKFLHLFKGKFVFITTNGGHCPHFQLPSLEFLLQVDGIAENIWEEADTAILETDLLSLVQNKLFLGLDWRYSLRRVLGDGSKLKIIADYLKVRICDAQNINLRCPPDETLEKADVVTLMHMFHSISISAYLPLTLTASFDEGGFLKVQKNTTYELIKKRLEDKGKPTKFIRNFEEYFEQWNPRQDSVGNWLYEFRVKLIKQYLSAEGGGRTRKYRARRKASRAKKLDARRFKPYYEP